MELVSRPGTSSAASSSRHVQLAQHPTRHWQPFEMRAADLHHIIFRAKAPRGIGGAHPVDPATDRPQPPVAFRVRNVRVTA
jgi:hypothetical protein